MLVLRECKRSEYVVDAEARRGAETGRGIDAFELTEPFCGAVPGLPPLCKRFVSVIWECLAVDKIMGVSLRVAVDEVE